jgi:hypothetical protein
MQNTKPKQPYYRKPVPTLQKLEENVKRICTDHRMGGTTKRENIEKMFLSYKDNNEQRLFLD